MLLPQCNWCIASTGDRVPQFRLESVFFVLVESQPFWFQSAVFVLAKPKQTFHIDANSGDSKTMKLSASVLSVCAWIIKCIFIALPLPLRREGPLSTGWQRRCTGAATSGMRFFFVRCLGASTENAPFTTIEIAFRLHCYRACYIASLLTRDRFMWQKRRTKTKHLRQIPFQFTRQWSHNSR